MPTLRDLSAATRRVGVLGVLGVLGVVVLAGCISTDPETQEQLDAAIEQSEDLENADFWESLSAEEQGCIEDALGDSDLSPVQILTDSSAAGIEARIEMTRFTIECVGDPAANAAYVATFTTTIAAALGPASDLDDSEGGCLLRHIITTAEDPAELLVAGTSDDTAEVMGTGMELCFDDASIAAVLGEEGTGPQAYGDDPDLDALYDACAGGDDRTCDLLYISVSEGSEYQALAIDCAGRGDGFGYCTAGIVQNADGFADPTSPGLATLTVDCVAGDMIACDTLYAVAPIGTEAENTGFTCGGKIAVGAVPNCRTRFGS